MMASASSRVNARSVSVSSAPWRPSFVMISSATSSLGASNTSTTSYWPSVTHTPTSLPPASSIIRSPSSTRSRQAGRPTRPVDVQRMSETKCGIGPIFSFVRLNAFLARAGVASRRKSDDLIKAGRVLVNGEPGQLNTFVQATDRVEVDGREVAKQKLAHLLLYKPAGIVTTASDPHGRPTVVQLVPNEPRVVPVGRLDADTTGALLLTNDGPLAHRLAEGVELDDGRTAPARARRLGRNRIELALHEGRNRQVKRMLEAVGHRVTHLHRSAYAGLTLEGLEPGAWSGRVEQGLRLVDPALCLLLAQCLAVECRLEERRLDLPGECVSLRRQT